MSPMKRFCKEEAPSPPVEELGHVVLDHLLKDAKSRKYILSHLLKATDTSPHLSGNDLVELVFLNDCKFCHALTRLESLPFRVVEAIKIMYRKIVFQHDFQTVGSMQQDGRVELSLCFHDSFCIEEWERAYTCRIEEVVHEECIPIFEEDEDLSDYAQPDTVLHDAYVYHSMGHQDVIQEHYIEDLSRFSEETTDGSTVVPEWITIETVDHSQVWVRKPRVRIVITTS